MKIAFVKQDCYQDLWIGDINDSSTELLLSTQMRVGPLGFITLYNADFYIVKLENDKECNFWKTQAYLDPEKVSIIQEKRYSPANLHLGNDSFKFHQDYAIDSSVVNWGNYDCVISINIAIPWRIRKLHSQVLWVCIPGEGFLPAHHYEFDYFTTHNVASSPLPRGRLLDIPYTFIGSDCLEKLMNNSVEHKAGIYAEINCTEVRPPTLESIPNIVEIAREVDLGVNLHQSSVKDNLVTIMKSKYFIKYGGRDTRGNAFIESISCGTPVLFNPYECFGNLPLPTDSYFFSREQLVEKLKFLEANPNEYQNLLKQQRLAIQTHVVDYVDMQLKYAIEKKFKNMSKKIDRGFSRKILGLDKAKKCVRRQLAAVGAFLHSRYGDF